MLFIHILSTKPSLPLNYPLFLQTLFTQDANLRAASPTPEWIITFYDGLNRPVMTALYPTTSSQATLQASMNSVDSTTGVQSYTIPDPENLSVNQRNPSVTQYVARNSITFLPGFTSSPNDNFTASINPSGNSTTETVTVSDPMPGITGYTPLTFTYYDNYSWQGAQNFNSTDAAVFPAASANQHPDVVTPSPETQGLVTGTKVRVLNPTSGGEQWLTTTNYYDIKGRPIQVLAGNISGGTDIQTTEYDFTGRTLATYMDHNNAASATTPAIQVLTTFQYDQAGRLLSVSKELNNNPATQQTIASYSYNELGQLVKKTLSPSSGGGTGGGLDTLHYDYNVRGWLSGINKPYVNSTTTPTPGPGAYFGTELDYDYGINQPQVNGNIAGEKWKSASDGDERAYGFTYDNANRLLKADFTQFSPPSGGGGGGGSWNNTFGSGNIDFSVSNLQYDANGNIQSMRQTGLKVNNSAPIDELNYQYNPNSNQLFSVTDTVSDPNTTLGDFHDGTNPAGSADYAYDSVGNLTEDLNKGITNIHYNYLNLPDSITFSPPAGGGGGGRTIRFVYDATGSKWQKIVTDQTQSPAVSDTTTYINGFVYNNDTLQFFPTEEGRVRWLPPRQSAGETEGTFVYDYFERDQLGNVRMVLTTQTKEDIYAATMEPQNAAEEDSLFDNISNTSVPAPPGFTNDPNDKEVSQLDGSDGNNALPRVGPAIVLKVMAGDTITIATQAWYQAAAQPPPPGATNLLNDLLSALTGGVITNSHSLYSITDNNPNTILSGDLGQFFTNDENANYTTAAPKAFLNWVTFDNQMNMVSGNSGVVQVPQISAGETAQPLVAPQLIIQKDGYIYIYVSNESAMKVYFDNLVIHHNRGPILQTDSYYPYGLTMAGISDQAALMPENKQLFNDGSELQHEEFSDGTGLDWYNMPYRNYDPQIGMFHNIDPMPSDMISPYSYATDNPLMFEDPSGASVTLGQFLINTLYNPNSNGGTWINDGSDDNNGDPTGSESDLTSQEDALYAGEDQFSALGLWGGDGGAFAANSEAATNTFNAETGDNVLPEVSIIQNDPASWAAAQMTIYSEVQQSLDEISNGEGLGEISNSNGEWLEGVDRLNDGLGGFGEGLSSLSGTFRLTNGVYNGSRLSLKYYESGWGGGSRAGIITYDASGLGEGLARGSIVAGALLGGVEVFQGYQEDGDTYGIHAQLATGSAVGGVGGAWAGAEVGAEAGAAIGVWFGGVGAVPGALIGGIVGGFVGGWAGSSMGEAAVEEMQ